VFKYRENEIKEGPVRDLNESASTFVRLSRIGAKFGGVES
jgi:hypothetical protein